MSTIIRMQRQGAPHRPFWRVVVADSRHPKGCVELLGTYDNLRKPAVLTLDEGKTKHWLQIGAKPTPTMKSLLVKQGLVTPVAGGKKPKK
jgi:small subunit ribosomal protein S16